NVGGFTGTKDGMIKPPTLRNTQDTAPYFHNGNVWTLKEAVKLMGDIQLGMKISDKDADKIVTFLNSLTGKKPEITYPVLPIATDKTPKPDMN
ncbi:MAG: cytochrome C biogenesis protein CcsA, partial [Arcobacteraceae bacterium]